MYVTFLSNSIPSCQCTERVRTANSIHTHAHAIYQQIGNQEKNTLYILLGASHFLLWMCIYFSVCLFMTLHWLCLPMMQDVALAMSGDDQQRETAIKLKHFEECRRTDWIDCNYLVMMSYRYIGFPHNRKHIIQEQEILHLNERRHDRPVTKNCRKWDKEDGIQKMLLT